MIPFLSRNSRGLALGLAGYNVLAALHLYPLSMNSFLEPSNHSARPSRPRIPSSCWGAMVTNWSRRFNLIAGHTASPGSFRTPCPHDIKLNVSSGTQIFCKNLPKFCHRLTFRNLNLQMDPFVVKALMGLASTNSSIFFPFLQALMRSVMHTHSSQISVSNTWWHALA